MNAIDKRAWKRIEGYKTYAITRKGKVFYRIWIYGKGYTWIFKKPRVEKTGGYLSVTLYKDGKRRTFKIHRLVAQAFIPNPKQLPEVNHEDGDKTNDRETNLRWCTREYNIKHAYRSGLKSNKGSKNPRVKLSEGTVKFIRESKLTGRALARMFKVGQNHISRIKHYKAWDL